MGTVIKIQYLMSVFKFKRWKKKNLNLVKKLSKLYYNLNVKTLFFYDFEQKVLIKDKRKIKILIKEKSKTIFKKKNSIFGGFAFKLIKLSFII